MKSIIFGILFLVLSSNTSASYNVSDVYGDFNNINLLRIKRSNSASVSAPVLNGGFNSRIPSNLNTDRYEIFKAKHYFDSTFDSNFVRSPDSDLFDVFQNPDVVKKYIIKLNTKIYGGDILPSLITNEKRYYTWFSQIRDDEYNKISMIESKYSAALENDIKQQLAKQSIKGAKTNDVTTKNTYVITTLFFEDSGQEVLVKATQDRWKVTVSVDDNGKITHFKKLVDKVNSNSYFRGEVEVAKFKKSELWKIARITKNYWDRLEPQPFKKSVVTADLPESFVKRFEEAIRPKTISPGAGSGGPNKGSTLNGVSCTNLPTGRRRRAISTGSSNCVLILNPNGELDSIDGDKFMEAYKKADSQQKEEMVQVLKENFEKLHLDEGKINDLKRVIELENMKAHAVTVDIVTEIQNTKLVAPTEDFFGHIDIMEGKFAKLKTEVRLSSYIMSEKISGLANSEALNRYSEGIGKAGKIAGNVVLTETVINGILHGDNTSLIIIGARAGLDVSLKIAESGGSKMLTRGMRGGKLVKGLGKLAGPIGGVFDLGLSIYSLTNSIKSLGTAKNKYERNDAIADIVSSSIDIGINVAIEVAFVTCPIAIPFLIAFQLLKDLVISIFKAANEVNRINARIPLSKSEKAYVGSSRFFDIFGLRRSDYIDGLLEDQTANNIAANLTIEFLKDNEDIRGIVIPSQTMTYDGSCRLVVEKCDVLELFGSCWSRSTTELGNGCDRGRRCPPPDGRICADYKEGHNYLIVDMSTYYRCKCRKAQTTFGDAHKDSTIDFRNKQTIYWERSVPEEVENGNFKCKPGSLKFIDYKIHQEKSRHDFYCENAMALLQATEERIKKSTIMVFNLEDGHDTIHASSDVPVNQFRVCNGTKEYYGGNVPNSFFIDDPCDTKVTGILSGGDSTEDAINFDESCGKGKYLNFNLPTGKISTADGNVDLDVRSLEQINGRENEGDEVVATCPTKKIALGGGNSKRPDIIKLPINDCPYNLTLAVRSFTNLESKAKNGHISMFILDKPWEGIHANLDVHPKTDFNFDMIFSSAASQDVLIEQPTFINNIFHLMVKGIATKKSAQIALNFSPDTASSDVGAIILFSEAPNGSPHSIFQASSNSTFFYHKLPELKQIPVADLKRVGCQYTENIFEISGTNWSVQGGEQSDQFILNNKNIASLNGGKGEDSLTLHQNLTEHVDINFTENRKFVSIEKFQSSPGNSFRVTTACSTSLVASLGGNLSTPAEIIVPQGKCEQRELQILAKANSRVVVRSEMGNHTNDKIILYAVASELNDALHPLQFGFETESNSLSGFLTAIQVTHKNWTVNSGNSCKNGKSICTMLSGINKEFIKLTLRDQNNENDEYLTAPYIQMSIIDSEEPARPLMIERDTFTPKVLYQLGIENATTNISSKIEGYFGIPNIFIISGGTWEIKGGSSNDSFIVTTSNQTGRILLEGGFGDDTLFLETSAAENDTEAFLVNLKTQEIGCEILASKGSVKNIENVFGRSNYPDIIYTACDTMTINGRNGTAAEQIDQIFVSDEDCQTNQKLIFVNSFTKIENLAKQGVFIYFVPDPTTVAFNITPTSNNTHVFKFQFNPWEYLQNVTFIPENHTLEIAVESGSKQKIHGFQMFKENSSDEYSNPAFEFHDPNYPFTSDLRVTKDGITAATIVIEGAIAKDENIVGLPIDVNRFLVNITNTGFIAGGGNLTGGSASSANQFWIFQLDSPLDTLDGGDCNNTECTNYLQFDDFFETKKPLEVFLGNGNGSIIAEKNTRVSKLLNFHQIVGRDGAQNHDKVILSQCDAQEISKFEEIVIKTSEEYECKFSLSLQLGPNTTVFFENEFYTNSSKWVNSTFHYNFDVPASFNVNGRESLSWVGPSHIYHFSFKVEDLEYINFYNKTEELFYSINGLEYRHKMLSPVESQQFYPQPIMFDRAGFRIQVGRTGNLMFFFSANSTFPKDLHKEVVPKYEAMAVNLGVTILIQTEDQFIFAGHGNKEGDRNIIQNAGYCHSHLGGGGADDTIYEITSLQHDVYIHTGIEIEQETDLFWNGTKQIIDLTDIIVPIRSKSATKYVPSVFQQGDNLQIIMNGHENEHPGKIVIRNGVEIAHRLQLLLSHALLDLVELKNEQEKEKGRIQKRSINLANDSSTWQIKPKPIIIPDSMVFSIAKQELEDGHILQVKENVTEAKTAFRAARNGSDLYLTNIRGSQSNNTDDNDIRITTVIILDYFEHYVKEEVEDPRFKEIMKEDYRKPLVLPNFITNVTVDLPGFHVLVNEFQILAIKEEEMNSSPNLKMEPVEIVEWKCLLHEYEDYILRDMPDITREFRADGCNKNNILGYAAIPVCIALITLLGILLVARIRRKVQDWKESQFEPLNSSYKRIQEESNEQNPTVRNLKSVASSLAAALNSENGIK